MPEALASSLARPASHLGRGRHDGLFGEYRVYFEFNPLDGEWARPGSTREISLVYAGLKPGNRRSCRMGGSRSSHGTQREAKNRENSAE